MDALKSELSGNFEDCLLAILEPAALYDAKCLRRAMEVRNYFSTPYVDHCNHTYQPRAQSLLSCFSHIGKREDPSDEAGHISIGYLGLRLGSVFFELHCGSNLSHSMLMCDLEMAFWVWLFITANIP